MVAKCNKIQGPKPPVSALGNSTDLVRKVGVTPQTITINRSVWKWQLIKYNILSIVYDNYLILHMLCNTVVCFTTGPKFIILDNDKVEFSAYKYTLSNFDFDPSCSANWGI